VDAAAFAALAQELRPVLYSIALNLCREPTEAADVVQDTFERALRSLSKRPFQGSPTSWLATILRNRVIDGWRSAKARSTAPEEQALEIPEEPPESGPRWSAITGAQLEAAIETLPDDFRASYRLHAVEGLSYQEVARRLGVPSATVGTRILRARRKLRDLLQPHLAALDAEEEP
jgi:RNA polymerase sigma-70 factor (ECF subfamily)